MAFIRRVRTGSGATAAQVAEYAAGRQRIVKHVGSAHTEVELGVLLEKARALLADPSQGVLDLAVTSSPPVAALVEASGTSVLFETSGTTPPADRDGVPTPPPTTPAVLPDLDRPDQATHVNDRGLRPGL